MRPHELDQSEENDRQIRQLGRLEIVIPVVKKFVASRISQGDKRDLGILIIEAMWYLNIEILTRDDDEIGEIDHGKQH
jgi:hypothetical protein